MDTFLAINNLNYAEITIKLQIKHQSLLPILIREKNFSVRPSSATLGTNRRLGQGSGLDGPREGQGLDLAFTFVTLGTGPSVNQA